MNTIKYLARYQVENLKGKGPEWIKDFIERHQFVYPEGTQLCSHGFTNNDNGEAYLTGKGFVIAYILVAERSAPSQLVKAHLDSRILEFKGKGITIGKKEKTILKAEIKQELSLSMPPNQYKCPAVFLPDREELWLLCSGRGMSDKISPRINMDLYTEGLKINNLHKNVAKKSLKPLFMDQKGNNQLMIAERIVLQKDNGAKIPTFYDSGYMSMQSMIRVFNSDQEIIEYSVEYKDLVSLVITNKSEFKGIVVEDELKSQWYTDGDPEEWENLSTVGFSIWIDTMLTVAGIYNSVIDSNENIQNEKVMATA